MDPVDDAGDGPVLEADQRTDGQKTFDSRRPGNCRYRAALQLADEDAKLDADYYDCCQKQVLDDFTNELDFVLTQFCDLYIIVFMILGR